jgi:hypothetical protein
MVDASALISRRPEILVSAQNEWYTQPIPCGAVAGPDTVITIGGSTWLQIGGPRVPDLDAFLNKDPADVAEQIQLFLNRHPTVSCRTNGLVIMDIEHPHPKDFHEYRVPVQDKIVDAFMARATAAREKFPRAKLGFYGTLLPDARGRADDKKYRARKRSLVRAGRRGMFDSVDCLIPVVYPRFGPTDRSWNTYEAYTRLAISGSRALRKSDGGTLAIVPLVTYSVANGNSNHHETLLLDLKTPHPLKNTLGVQYTVMAEEQVQTAVFWVGENSDVITNRPNPKRRTVSQHVCGV